MADNTLPPPDPRLVLHVCTVCHAITPVVESEQHYAWHRSQERAVQIERSSTQA